MSHTFHERVFDTVFTLEHDIYFGIVQIQSPRAPPFQWFKNVMVWIVEVLIALFSKKWSKYAPFPDKPTWKFQRFQCTDRGAKVDPSWISWEFIHSQAPAVRDWNRDLPSRSPELGRNIKKTHWTLPQFTTCFNHTKNLLFFSPWELGNSGDPCRFRYYGLIRTFLIAKSFPIWSDERPASWKPNCQRSLPLQNSRLGSKFYQQKMHCGCFFWIFGPPKKADAPWCSLSLLKKSFNFDPWRFLKPAHSPGLILPGWPPNGHWDGHWHGRCRSAPTPRSAPRRLCDGSAGGPMPVPGSFSRLPIRVPETFLTVDWWFWWSQGDPLWLKKIRKTWTNIDSPPFFQWNVGNSKEPAQIHPHSKWPLLNGILPAQLRGFGQVPTPFRLMIRPGKPPKRGGNHNRKSQPLVVACLEPLEVGQFQRSDRLEMDHVPMWGPRPR